jgi:putative endonuclease
MAANDQWHIYIVRCRDGTLYTGIAMNLKKRIGEHNSREGGARYTRSRQPVELVYSERAASRSEALKREYEIKRLPRAKKKQLSSRYGKHFVRRSEKL